MPGLNLAVSYGLTDARFDTYYRDTVKVDPTKAVNYGGNYFPFVPRNTIMGAASYYIPLKSQSIQAVSLNCNYQGVGKIYWTDDNKGYQDFYGVVNGKISLHLNHMKLEVWGKNMAAQDYHGFYFPMSGKSFVQVGKPRMFGVNLIVNI